MSMMLGPLREALAVPDPSRLVLVAVNGEEVQIVGVKLDLLSNKLIIETEGT